MSFFDFKQLQLDVFKSHFGDPLSKRPEEKIEIKKYIPNAIEKKTQQKKAQNKNSPVTRTSARKTKQKISPAFKTPKTRNPRGRPRKSLPAKLEKNDELLNSSTPSPEPPVHAPVNDVTVHETPKETPEKSLPIKKRKLLVGTENIYKKIYEKPASPTNYITPEKKPATAYEIYQENLRIESIDIDFRRSSRSKLKWKAQMLDKWDNVVVNKTFSEIDDKEEFLFYIGLAKHVS